MQLAVILVMFAVAELVLSSVPPSPRQIRHLGVKIRKIEDNHESWEILHRLRRALKDEADIRIAIPYAGSVTHELGRLGRGIRIASVSKPISTLGSTLCSKQKHKLPKGQQSELVYGIHCSCGCYYVGESGRELQERVKEHKTGYERNQASTAFGAVAHRTCEPSFDIQDVNILGREKKEPLRKLLESVHIRTVGRVNTIIPSPNDDVINRQAGQDLDELWIPLLFGETRE